MPLSDGNGLQTRTRKFPISGLPQWYLRNKTDFGGLFPPPILDEYRGSMDGFGHLTGTQTTVSEDHPGWKARSHGIFNGDIGGEFRTEYVGPIGKGEFPVQSQVLEGLYTYFNQTQRSKYVGPVLPCAPYQMTLPSFSPSSDTRLDALGAQAIARVKPTNSIVDLSTALGETLREGLPNLMGHTLEHWRNTTARARKASSSEYLNYEFGWKPVVSDVQSLMKAIVNVDNTLAQYERDAGRLVRRRYEFPPDVEDILIEPVTVRSTPFIGASAQGMFNPNVLPGGCMRIRERVRRQWFSGGFTYANMFDAGSARAQIGNEIRQAKKLFGLSLTPDTVWNLSPWSWAVDWVSNTGDVISNLTDFAVDGLVLKYGYMMETTLITETYAYSGPTGFYTSTVYPSTCVFVKQIKTRRKASPYGFGLTMKDFTPRQIAIMISLGLLKG